MTKEDLERTSRFEHTTSLVARAARGEVAAQNQLVERYWAALRHWAHGRLPPTARARIDTEDLVQLTLLKTLDKLGTFEPRREGAFTAYLHQVLLNQIRDEIRRAKRRPAREPIDDKLQANDASPLEKALDAEFAEAYEKALGRLTEEQRKAVVMRMELGHSHAEIAKALGRPSPAAARMLVSRALSRLAEWI